MSFQAEFTEQFWEDYEAALTYLADDLENPEAAYALDRELDRVVRLLMRYPHVSAPYPFLDETGTPYYHCPVRRLLAFTSSGARGCSFAVSCTLPPTFPQSSKNSGSIIQRSPNERITQAGAFLIPDS